MQKLHILQVPFALSAILMILHHRSFMDIDLIQNLRRDLIGAQRLIYLFQSHVVHDDIAGIKEIAIGHILYGQSQCRQVIAVHDEDIFFSKIIQCIDEIRYKLIHFMQLVYIIFPLVILLLGGRAADLDDRILQHLFRRILAVSLDGNGIDKVLTRRGFQVIQDLIYQDLIL